MNTAHAFTEGSDCHLEKQVKPKPILGRRLAVLLASDGRAAVIHKADQARGLACDAVIWLRKPTAGQRFVVMACTRYAPCPEERFATGKEPA